jgi:hypothetical protein
MTISDSIEASEAAAIVRRFHPRPIEPTASKANASRIEELSGYWLGRAKVRQGEADRVHRESVDSRARRHRCAQHAVGRGCAAQRDRGSLRGARGRAREGGRMIPRRITGANVEMKPPAGWDQDAVNCASLWVRASQHEGQLIVESAWEPTAEELAMLNAGGSVVLKVFGGQPPVWIKAAPPVEA